MFTSNHDRISIMDVLQQQAGGGAATAAPQQGTAPAADINSTAARPEPAMEWTEGDLPEQGFGRTTLMPGIYTFKLPATIAQLWATVEVEDNRQFLANGQPNPTYKQKVQRQMLKFSRTAPLTVEGGEHHGEPMTWNPSTNPRPRGKKDDPKTPWISEIAYLLDVGLQGGLPAAQRVRPTSTEAVKAEINKYAGKLVRLETGLSAQCRPDKVRYIVIETVDDQGQRVETLTQDPSGQKGCGKRYYTKDFKNPDAKPGESAFDTEILCDCGAALRGFESVEKILPPLGA